MNILLGTYACEPNIGSEPEVGWQMANEIAKAMPNDSIYVITKANNKMAIEQEIYPENIKFYYYELPKWSTFWKKGGRGIRTYYYFWMIGAALYMKRQNIVFDIIHHVTFVNDWLPSFFSLLKNKKNRFIWGPIGSHDPIDSKFLDGNKRNNIEKFRIFLQLFFRNIDPFFHISKTKADCIIGINKNVKNKLKLKVDKYFIAEPAIAMKKNVVEKIEDRKRVTKEFKILSVGRLLYIKNFKLTLLAYAKFLKDNPSTTHTKLQIIGDGDDRKSLEKLVLELKINDLVEFVGKIPLDKVQQRFSEVDLFLFPTLENAGFVILEAMSHALPIVAMNYGGPQQFVISNISSQLVNPNLEYEKIIEALSEQISTLYKDRNLSFRIGRQNREDVLNHFTWEAKAKKIKTIYKKVRNET